MQLELRNVIILCTFHTVLKDAGWPDLVSQSEPTCSDCDQPDEVRGPGQGRLAVRDQGREQQPGDLLRPQEEESGEEGRRETAAVGDCQSVVFIHINVKSARLSQQ